MKKFLSVLLILALFLTSVFAFPDVPDDHWAKADIDAMVRRGVINGMDNGTFAPESPVSAAHFATMLVKLQFADDLASVSPTTPAWWAGAMQTAQARGLLAGIPVGASYAKTDGGAESWDAALVEAPMTRYEMAQVSVNLLHALDIPAPDAAALDAARTAIADYDTIPENYRDAVVTAYALGVLNGVDDIGTFAGESGMNRAQAARVMSNILAVLPPVAPPPEEPRLAVTLDHLRVTMNVGESITLTPQVTGPGSEDAGCLWSSSDPAVIASGDGTDATFTALAAGEAELLCTAYAGEETATAVCTVTVVASAASRAASAVQTPSRSEAAPSDTDASTLSDTDAPADEAGVVLSGAFCA